MESGTQQKDSGRPQSLTQQHWLFGKRHYRFEGGDRLKVVEQQWFSQSDTLISLEDLQANPSYHSAFALRLLLYGAAAVLMLAFLVFWAVFTQQWLILIGVGITALLVLLLFYRFFLFTTRLCVYRHAKTGEPYVFFWLDRPVQADFNEFIEELSWRVNRSQKKAAMLRE